MILLAHLYILNHNSYYFVLFYFILFYFYYFILLLLFYFIFLFSFSFFPHFLHILHFLFFLLYLPLPTSNSPTSETITLSPPHFFQILSSLIFPLSFSFLLPILGVEQIFLFLYFSSSFLHTTISRDSHCHMLSIFLLFSSFLFLSFSPHHTIFHCRQCNAGDMTPMPLLAITSLSHCL